VSDTNQASVYAIVRVSVPNGPPKGTPLAHLCLYVRFHTVHTQVEGSQIVKYPYFERDFSVLFDLYGVHAIVPT
jgi:hypothetical protein